MYTGNFTYAHVNGMNQFLFLKCWLSTIMPIKKIKTNTIKQTKKHMGPQILPECH